MFIINVALGNTSWRLLFKDEVGAGKAVSALCTSEPAVEIADDFGQALFATTKSIHGWMLEDMDKTKMAHVEMALHQARTQGLATKMAQHDPALKAQSNMGGPSVLNPMGNGFRPPSN